MRARLSQYRRPSPLGVSGAGLRRLHSSLPATASRGLRPPEPRLPSWPPPFVSRQGVISSQFRSQMAGAASLLLPGRLGPAAAPDEAAAALRLVPVASSDDLSATRFLIAAIRSAPSSRGGLDPATSLWMASSTWSRAAARRGGACPILRRDAGRGSRSPPLPGTSGGGGAPPSPRT